jgi:hypothetical protein
MRRFNTGEKIGFGLLVVGAIAGTAGWGAPTWLRIANLFGLTTMFLSGLFLGYWTECDSDTRPKDGDACGSTRE